LKTPARLIKFTDRELAARERAAFIAVDDEELRTHG
jgi:hypothetical protein